MNIIEPGEQVTGTLNALVRPSCDSEWAIDPKMIQLSELSGHPMI